jgi:hypothetical protein
MNCPECEKKEKRIAELEGMVARITRSVDSGHLTIDDPELQTTGFIETPADRNAKVLSFQRAMSRGEFHI